MKKSELQQIIREEISKTLNENRDNYMFFQNLQTIRDAVDKMLSLDPSMVDMILSDGHDWANDHIAVAKENIDQVFDFLMRKKTVAEKFNDRRDEIDVAEPKGEITSADFKALRTMRKK
jgi:hypothetical protein